MFLDESGNLGFKFERGSTAYFVIAFLLVDDPWPLRDRIAQLRTRLGLRQDFEFKFHKTNRAAKVAFFQAVAGLAFQIRAVAIDKRELPSRFWTMGRQEFYNFFIGELLLRISDEELTNGILLVDGSTKSQRFVRGLRKHLSLLMGESGRSRKFKKMREIDSKQDDGIQCVDMIAGAIAEETFKGGSEHYALIKDKIQDLWLYLEVTE